MDDGVTLRYDSFAAALQFGGGKIRYGGSSMRRAILVAVLAGCGGESGDTGGSTGGTTGGATSGGVMTSTGEAPTSGSGGSSESTGDTPTGSTGDTGGSSTGGDPCVDDPLTWENFGQAFTMKWCTECHNSQLPTAMRSCAPCSVNLDTHGGVAKFAPLMLLRAVDYAEKGLPPMPPVTDIPAEERALLGQYLNCGAPGPETKDMALTCPDPDTVPMCFKSHH